MVPWSLIASATRRTTDPATRTIEKTIPINTLNGIDKASFVDSFQSLATSGV